MKTVRAAIGNFPRARGFSKPSQRRELYRSLSTERSQQTDTTPHTPPSSSVPLSLYCWGTNDKGSIPTKEALEEGRNGGGGGAGNLLNRGGAIVDHPSKIDFKDAFGA